MPIITKTQTIQTPAEGFVGITNKIQYIINEIIYDNHLDATTFDGSVTIFAPHTTAAITINENADPDVQHDFFIHLNEAVQQNIEFVHENAHAHIKSSLVGCSETLLIHEGKLMLGTMQAIYFCEFDGPRTRSFIVQVTY